MFHRVVIGAGGDGGVRSTRGSSSANGGRGREGPITINVGIQSAEENQEREVNCGDESTTVAVMGR